MSAQTVRHRAAAPPSAAASPLQVVLALLRTDLPGDVWGTPESWPRWRTLLPSVLTATGHPRASEEEPTAWLLVQAGNYLNSQGRYAEALPLQQRALRIGEAALGPDHPDVAAGLSYVGWALSELGRHAEALSLQQRALRVREAALGPDHPYVATGLSHVGRVLSELGRHVEALPLQQRALRIREAALGPDHPFTRRTRSYVEDLQAQLLATLQVRCGCLIVRSLGSAARRSLWGCLIRCLTLGWCGKSSKRLRRIWGGSGGTGASLTWETEPLIRAASSPGSRSRCS